MHSIYSAPCPHEHRHARSAHAPSEARRGRGRPRRISHRRRCSTPRCPVRGRSEYGDSRSRGLRAAPRCTDQLAVHLFPQPRCAARSRQPMRVFARFAWTARPGASHEALLLSDARRAAALRASSVAAATLARWDRHISAAWHRDADPGDHAALCGLELPARRWRAPSPGGYINARWVMTRTATPRAHPSLPAIGPLDADAGPGRTPAR